MYGSVPPNNTAFSTYTIDTASLVTFTNPNITQYTSRQLFYQSPDLDDGEHTLAVNAPDTVIGDGASQFYFDFLTYVPSAPSSNVTTQASSAGPSSKSPDLKTILPAVLVPCIFIIIVLGLGLYMQRRRMRILRAKSEINENISYKQLESGERHVAYCAAPRSNNPPLGVRSFQPRFCHLRPPHPCMLRQRAHHQRHSLRCAAPGPTRPTRATCRRSAAPTLDLSTRPQSGCTLLQLACFARALRWQTRCLRLLVPDGCSTSTWRVGQGRRAVPLKRAFPRCGGWARTSWLFCG